MVLRRMRILKPVRLVRATAASSMPAASDGATLLASAFAPQPLNATPRDVSAEAAAPLGESKRLRLLRTETRETGAELPEIKTADLPKAWSKEDWDETKERHDWPFENSTQIDLTSFERILKVRNKEAGTVKIYVGGVLIFLSLFHK